MIRLFDYQKAAVDNLDVGKILCGGVGSGKSITAIYYYFTKFGGSLEPFRALPETAKKLYVITTAKKRDSAEFEKDMVHFCLNMEEVVVDSWNNIKKYEKVVDGFFIFDEQKISGKGVWVKAFLKIAKNNEWILLTATPGDTWQDYIPVFLANGFYRNRTQFNDEHVIFDAYAKYPSIKKYVNTRKLERLRDSILVDMAFTRPTTRHYEAVMCPYDISMYKDIYRLRWDPFKNQPIASAPEFCYLLRKVVNSHVSRLDNVVRILSERKKAIIFYNFDYELGSLRERLNEEKWPFSEWNSHKHEKILEGEKWAYLVQYFACEGWNVTTCDTIIFFSQNYSYKVFEQASGRIDRLNTPYKDLWYYVFRSSAGIDLAIARAIRNKKNFNESRFVKGD